MPEVLYSGHDAVLDCAGDTTNAVLHALDQTLDQVLADVVQPLRDITERGDDLPRQLDEPVEDIADHVLRPVNEPPDQVMGRSAEQPMPDVLDRLQDLLRQRVREELPKILEDAYDTIK